MVLIPSRVFCLIYNHVDVAVEGNIFLRIRASTPQERQELSGGADLREKWF